MNLRNIELEKVERAGCEMCIKFRKLKLFPKLYTPSKRSCVRTTFRKQRFNGFQKILRLFVRTTFSKQRFNGFQTLF